MGAARTDILVTGTGSLSSAVLYALMAVPDQALRICVMSRGTGWLHWLVRAVVARARCLNIDLQIEAVQADWQNHDALCRALERCRPRLVIHTASLQSPWAFLERNDWSELVKAVGYGMTLPLHLVLARRFGRALLSAIPDALFINACYPDALNQMLTSAAIPVVCGTGNVATLTALMGAESPSAGDLQMIAHHAHVTAAISGTDRSLQFLKAWRNGVSIDAEARAWVREAHLPSDERLNVVTGAVTAQIAMSLLGLRDPLRTNLPGPLGLPGGYPVYVQSGKLSLNLPRGLSVSEAVQWNRAAAYADGVTVDEQGIARLTDEAAATVSDFAESAQILTEPLSAEAVEARATALLQLRAKLSASRDERQVSRH